MELIETIEKIESVYSNGSYSLFINDLLIVDGKHLEFNDNCLLVKGADVVFTIVGIALSNIRNIRLADNANNIKLQWKRK